MNDERISRLASMAGDALCLADRITRHGHSETLAQGSRTDRKNHVITDFLQSTARATEDTAHAPMPKGGISGLWDILKQPESQQTIQFLMRVGQHFHNHRLATRYTEP